jgi:hypothetical protein
MQLLLAVAEMKKLLCIGGLMNDEDQNKGL